MPHTISWEKTGAILKLAGIASLLARQQALNSLCSDPRFDAIRFVLVDYRDVTQYEVQGGAVEEMAALHIGALLTNPRVMIASVATQPEIIAAVLQMIGHGFIKAPQAIFPSIELAQEWIAEQLPR